VGRLGPEYLAAMSLGFLVILLIRGVGFGIRVAGQALVAQRVGAGDNEGAALMVGQILSLLAMILAPIVILGIWLSPRIIALFTSDPRILQLGTGYLRAGFAVLFWDLSLRRS
jgi:Na+-driven multidrug efflux pump